MQCIDDRNRILQSGKISLEVEASNVTALKSEIQAFRNVWDSFLSEATLVAKAMDIASVFKAEVSREKKRKRPFDETSEETPQKVTASDTFRNTVFYPAIDHIISDLDSRFKTITSIVEEFAAILKIGQLRDSDVASLCKPLISKYREDLTPHFESEIRHLNAIFSATFPSCSTCLDLLNAIYNMQLQSIYGEVCIALRIFCTLPVTVAGGQRAFSKLNLVKSFLRSTMSQERLNNLAILSI